MTNKGNFQHFVQVASTCGLDFAPHLKPALDMIAEDFHKNLKEECSAPRIGNVLEILGDIASLSNKLHGKLASLDIYSHSALAGEWSFPGTDSDLNSADIIESLSLAEIAPEAPDRLDAGFLKSLGDLSKLSGRRATEIKDAWSIRFESGMLDQGGKDDLHRMWLPTAKRALVRDCWVLATDIGDDFHPKSTVGGSFYLLVAAIYEYATGQDAEDSNVGLERYVKEVVGAAREVENRRQSLEFLEKFMCRRKELLQRRRRLSRIRQREQTLLDCAERRFRGFPLTSP